jgi:hypothetical protein
MRKNVLTFPLRPVSIGTMDGQTDFSALGKRALDTMSPEARTRRARLAVSARWQRARGEDADVDRKKRIHEALDRVLDILEGGRAPTARELAKMRDLKLVLDRISAGRAGA